MSEPGRRSRWWADRDEPEDDQGVEDPWTTGDDDMGLSEEQVRFLESLVDQPPMFRVYDSLPGLGAGEPEVHPKIEPGAETGD